MEWIVAAFVLGTAFIVAALLLRTKKQLSDSVSGRMDELSLAVSRALEMLDRRIQHVAESTERSHISTQTAIRDVVGHLTEQRAALVRVLEQSRDIARLQDILQPPRARGALGEKLLENILAQHLPGGEKAGLWERQHQFRSGERVDFVLKAGDLLIPIDAKFPIESFERLRGASPEEREKLTKEFAATVKQHAEAIRKKYIVPEEGTADFAMLYVPSEAVYAEILTMPELADAIFDRAIVPISPGTFFAYLRTILIGLRGMQVASSAREILAGLKALERELNALDERFRVSGGHLRNALRAHEDAERGLARFVNQLEDLGR